MGCTPCASLACVITPLRRHVLSAPHGLKIAVILNEFGEGVEEAYFQDLQGLRDSSGEWIELNNG